MKNLLKLFLPLAVLVLACGSVPAYAVPARSVPTAVKLPDGSTITLILYGDEFGHYTATSDGYEVVRGEDGFYYHVTLQGNTVIPTSIRAKEASRRSASDLAALSQVSRPGANNAQRLNVGRAEKMARMGITSYAAVQRSPMRAGEPVPKSKSVVLLVNFKDVKFTTPNPQQAVHNLLNQPGYAENGAIGSAWDYYFDNSNGRFDPQFDVFGPYEVQDNMSYYGSNENNVPGMVVEACKLAYADGVDFREYLNDQGRVKDVYVFYAGFAESYEGNDSNTIWPHRVANYLGYLDIISGLTFTGYACSSEFWGWENNPNRQGFTTIGTFCHEYGHVLGWPDFYDTDGSSNGTAITFQKYSLMDAGTHNADGAKPPALLAVERKLMGWLENETPLALNGNHELPDIYTTDSAYILETSNAGEYYMFEAKNSQNNKWDAGIRDELGTHVRGMLVTHIDGSSSYISRWNNNRLNAYSNHPCARVVKANKSNSSLSGWMFTSSVATLSGDTHSEFVPWSGTKHGYELKNINYADGKVTFYTGNPVAAESVTLNSGTASVSLGKQITLTATVLPENASDKAVTWTSTDSGVASVEGGVVTGMSAGQATITATVTGTSLSATCLVTVVDEISTVSLVSAYQNDAEVSWENSPHTGTFRLELYSGGEQQINTTTAEKGAYFALLKPGTSYTLVITAIYGDQSEGTTAEISFSTPATTQEFPSILVEKATYASGEAIPLRVLHTSPTLESVSWDVNGTAVSPPSAVLEPGRHRITVTITNEEGYSEKITKYITVQ